MKPVFALNLSHEGIILLHRSPRGTWTEVGDVALDDKKFSESLSFLRSTAVGLEGKGFGTKLIIPTSQVLCREIRAPGPGENQRRAQILSALEGETPYEVDDLTFDWTGNGPIVEVAVVWNETLDEAEEFAVEHRFNPISFVGDAREHPDGWEPFFGRTDFSHAFLGADADVRDTPEPDRNAPPDESLFIPPVVVTDDANTPPDANAVTNESPLSENPNSPDSENMFAKTAEEAGAANIFADDSKTPAKETPPVAKEGATDLSEETQAGAFSSRRDHSLKPEEVEDHPVSHRPARIGPARIGMVSAPEPTATEVPKTAPSSKNDPQEKYSAGTGIISEKRMRDSFLAEDSSARRLISKLATVAPLLMGAALKLGSAGSNLRAKLHRKPRMKSPQSSSPKKASGALSPTGKLSGSLLEKLTPTALNEPKIRRLAILAIGVIALIALIGLAYTMIGSRGGSGGENGAAADVPITRAAARGVRADNRASPRPNDFKAVVATIKGDQTTPPPSDIPLIRPQRRSKFEGGNDPLAGLGDTATPVTNLTEQELADIHAAGLKPPTREELAEYGPDHETNGSTRRTAAASYAATGALQRVRKPPNPLEMPKRDDIFVAAIDRPLKAGDAIILPDFSRGPRDDPPSKHMSPLGFDVVFDFDSKGFVKPTKTGALNPDGIPVFLGKPAFIPPEKPKTDVLVPPDPLAALTPKPRPANLKTGADAVFVQGRLTMTQLRAKRSKPRPISIQIELGAAGATPSELAVLTSFKPAKRPSDFAATVRKTRVKIASATPATAPILNTGPVLPIRASVAKNATIKRGINLSQISLIGVYGTEAKRRALMRLPSGRYVKVKKGDRLDGGKIAAIGIDSLRFAKGGRNRLLKMPRE